MIKGITVRLHERTQTGTDELNNPVYEETITDVDNVLVSPASSDDITDAQSLYGKMAVYTLAIPKGDAHIWEDALVEFFDATWQTIGFATEGIEDLIPLEWNKQIKVERYG